MFYWLKTKIKHILYNNFTDKEFSRFMKIRALTCQLGEIPNENQMLKLCPIKTLNSIREVLANEGQSLSKVLAKDIEDVVKEEEKRIYWKNKKRQQREKKTIVKEDSPGQSKHRVDKSRVDKSIYNTYNDNVLLKEVEYQKLIERIGTELTEKMIGKLSNYIGSTGKKYKSHYHTILMWVDKDKENKGKGVKSYARKTNADLATEAAREYIESLGEDDHIDNALESVGTKRSNAIKGSVDCLDF